MAEAKISLSIDGVQAVNSGLRQVDERLSSVTAHVKDQTASVLTLSDAQARMIESNRQLAESTRFLDSLKKQTDAIGKSAADLAEMRAQALGVSEAAAPLVAKLREAEKPVEKLGITSAQTAAAMRMVPAQFTDIVVGLQSGQRPMSVLLQQGGQLKDMFGGMGPAARGLATYVVGLVNPFTLAAGAAAVLAAAYFQGRKETEAYNQALILSGNVSGKTASQLQEAAQSVSKSVGTQAEAAAVLAELAGNGKIASDSFERFTRVAVQMEKVGKPVSDTISELSELGKAPVEASEKLNEKYHYLTDTVYKQIKALQDQGKADDAAAVAEKAYADAFDQRSKMLINQLGYAEKAWNSVAGAAKRGWDAFLDVGRPDTNADALRKGSDSAAVLQSVIDRLREPGGGLLQSAIADQLEKIVGKRKEENAYLQENARLERQGAAAQAENARLAEAQIKWDKDGEQYLSRQLQLGRDITKAREEGLAAGKSETEINQRIGEIRKKYADIYNDQVDSQIEAIKRRGQIEDEISKRSIAQIQLQHQIGGMNDEQEIEATANAEIAAIDRRKTALQEELAIVRAKPNSLKEQQALQGQIAVLSEQRLTREKQLEGDLIKLDVTRTRAAAEYYSEVLVKQADAEAKKLQDQVLAQKDYIEEIGLSKTALADLQAARLRDLAAMKDQQASQAELTDETGDWTAKLREQAQALRDLADGTQAAAQKQEMADMWRSIDQAGHDAFIHIGDSGKSAFDRILDTAKSGLLDFLYQITARKWLIDITASVTGGSLSGVAQAATSSATGSSISSLGAGAGLAGTLGSFGGGMSAGFAQLTAGVNPMAAMSSIADVSAGSLSTAIGQAIGYAGPVLAAAAAIYSIAKSLDHSGTYHTGALAQYSAVGGLQTGSNGTHAGPRAGDTNFGTGFGGVDFSRQTADFVSGISQSIVGILDSTASTFGKSAGYSAATAFADDTSRDGAWGALLISKAGEKLVDWQDTRNSKWSPHEFADGQAGQEQYLKDISQSVRTALDGIGLPGWAQHMLDALGDAPALTDLAAVVDKINAAQKVLASMGNSISGFANLDDSTVSALINASGGIDAFVAGMSSFYNDYTSESEKIAAASRQVTDTLSAVGLAMPQTKAEFSDLLRAELALGEAGAPAVAALLKVESAFGTVTNAAEALAGKRSDLDIQTMQLTGDAAGALAAQRAKELAAMDASLRPLQQRIYDLQDEAQAAENAKTAHQTALDTAMKGVNSAFSAVQRAVDAERKSVTDAYNGQVDSLNTRIEDVTGSVSKLTSLSESLRSTVERMRLPSERVSDRAFASAQIDSALLLARTGGVLPDAESLRNALDVIAQPSEDLFVTFTDYQRDFIAQRGKIDELARLTGAEKSIEEQTLESLQDQLKTTQEGYKDEMSRLDSQLSYEQQKVDILNGIDTHTLSVATAIAGLQIKLGTAQAAQAVVAGDSGTLPNSISGLYENILGRAPDAAGAAFWQSAMASNPNYQAGTSSIINDFINGALSGGTAQDKINAISYAHERHIPGFAGGGDHSGGWRIVGERGIELEATGPSRIFNASQTANILRGDPSNTQRLERLVEGLTAEVKRLQGLVAEGNDNTRQLADQFENVTEGGNLMRTEVFS